MSRKTMRIKFNASVESKKGGISASRLKGVCTPKIASETELHLSGRFITDCRDRCRFERTHTRVRRPSCSAKVCTRPVETPGTS